jgi:hypothetical protein
MAAIFQGAIIKSMILITTSGIIIIKNTGGISTKRISFGIFFTVVGCWFPNYNVQKIFLVCC